MTFYKKKTLYGYVIPIPTTKECDHNILLYPFYMIIRVYKGIFIYYIGYKHSIDNKLMSCIANVIHTVL